MTVTDTTSMTENMATDDSLFMGGRQFDSRLFVGTGKYADNDTMVEAIRASGTAMVTVAVRRVDLDRTKEEGILFHLDPDEFFLLPNTPSFTTYSCPHSAATDASQRDLVSHALVIETMPGDPEEQYL